MFSEGLPAQTDRSTPVEAAVSWSSSGGRSTESLFPPAFCLRARLRMGARPTTNMLAVNEGAVKRDLPSPLWVVD